MLEHSLLLITIACLIGFIMTWGVGANDLANIMSPTMGSKAVTVRQAMVITIVFEFAGAILGGSQVTETIRSGIINTSLLSHTPNILLYGMLSTLMAGAIWMLLASVIGMPVSITNAIVGALIGFGTIVFGPQAIHWNAVSKIAISWVCSPSVACLIGYLLFVTIRRTIFDTDNPAKSVRYYLPIYFLLAGMILGNMTVLKGIEHIGIILTAWQKFLATSLTGLAVMLVGMWLSLRVHATAMHKRFQQVYYVERLFSILMAFTACAMVFAHGSNDVAIAMGPVSAIISLEKQGHISGVAPSWVMWFGCIGIVTGLFMYGRKVIATVGSEITTLTPSRAFAATLAAAGTVIVSTSTGIPVSATQTLVGGVLGVGLARGIGALNLRVIRNIFLSWFVTIPVAALLDILFFYIFKTVFGG